MAHRKTELPVYIYVDKISKGKYTYFLGEFCEGINPTKNEVEWYKLYKKRNIRHLESSHGIEILRNPGNSVEMIVNFPNKDEGFAFPTLESIVSYAINIYKKEGYTTGLILGFEDEDPLTDRVLIIGEGVYNSEDEFLKEAQKKKFWLEM